MVTMGSNRQAASASESDLDPREVPAYTLTEAARYLQIPRRTVFNWLYGNWYPTKRGQQKARPLVEIAAPEDHLLSFVNMVELHVLDAIRLVHGIDVRQVRKALDNLQRELKVKRPLVDQQMETYGKKLLIRHLGKLIDAVNWGQIEMADQLGIRLARIERDPRGIVQKLYPFTRKKPAQLDAAEREPRAIAMDPSVAFGRPVIAGSRIPTVEVAERYKAGDSIEVLASEYARPQADIQEAIRCELRLDAA
jgi:uncharacterized protein (DUF433 family)